MRNSYAIKDTRKQMMPYQSLEHTFNRDLRLKRKTIPCLELTGFFFSDIKINLFRFYPETQRDM